mmetsp:Transcript_51118/g.76369  ORF Transcript_51118/g.76369 Transcript_51118/m.76369 type:complete len:125 (-) Transcript_51118:212-586(-)
MVHCRDIRAQRASFDSSVLSLYSSGHDVNHHNMKWRGISDTWQGEAYVVLLFVCAGKQKLPQSMARRATNWIWVCSSFDRQNESQNRGQHVEVVGWFVLQRKQRQQKRTDRDLLMTPFSSSRFE